MINRIIPTKLMIPTAIIRIIINPKGARKELGRVGCGPVVMEVIEEKMDKTQNTTVITVMIGMITFIKLAVRPNFLPDSSDILPLRCYFIAT